MDKDEHPTIHGDDPISRSLRSLLAKGLIVDSGERRNGQIVWVAVPTKKEKH